MPDLATTYSLLIIILRGLFDRRILLIDAGTGRNAVWITRNPLLPQQDGLQLGQSLFSNFAGT